MLTLAADSPLRSIVGENTIHACHPATAAELDLVACTAAIRAAVRRALFECLRARMLIDDTSHFIETAFLAMAALLPIVDPLGSVPLYLALTGPMTPPERARMARLVSINSFCILVASILVGAYVLDFFGVSIPAVQVGGGVIVCAFGWSLLTSPGAPGLVNRPTETGIELLTQRAFYPLSMPVTVGPGAISVAITLGANPPRSLRALLATSIAHVIGVLIIAVSIYLCYRYTERTIRRLGTTGTHVLIRLTSFITFCIGVQIIWNGLRALITEDLLPTLKS